MYLIANAFPIVGLHVQSQEQTTTLVGAVAVLWVDDMRFLAVLVALTTIAAPGILIGGLLYVLASLRLGRYPRGGIRIVRLIHTVEPWSMVEVFMLGVLVALVKLTHYARIELGVALWGFAGLMLLMAAVEAAFDPHELWDRLEATA